MNTVPKPETPPKRRGQRAWTDAQRAEQAAKLRTRQIWLKSTGPRTPHGKSISRLNALTHGATSRPAKDFMAHFKTYHAFIRLCWAKRAELIRIQKNELIDQHPKNHNRIGFSDHCGISHYHMTFSFSAPPPPQNEVS